MPFSVHARDFDMLSSVYSPLRATGNTSGNVNAKESTCGDFYQNAKRSCSSHYTHVHQFAELCPEAQMKLPEGVPVECFSSNFFDASHSRDDAPFPSIPALPKTLMARCGHFKPIQTGVLGERTVSSRRPLPSGNLRQSVAPHLGLQQPLLDAASFSSRTSSSVETLNLSEKHFKKGSSPPASAASTGVEAAVQMHLPPRCCYPHRTFPGTYYDVLGLPCDAPHSDIIAKYRAWQEGGFKRMRQKDPAGAETVDRIVVEARNVLGNPVLRAAYNQHLPSAPMKHQLWATASCGAGVTSTSTTPSKHRTQGLSSTTSSTFDMHHKLDESHRFHGHCRSDSSVHVDNAALMMTLSSLHSGESIW